MSTRHQEVYEAGSAFADYLSSPEQSVATRLGGALQRAGEPVLAELLRAFWTRGDHEQAAPFWGDDACCLMSATPPKNGGAQLWFDPFEVSVSLFVPDEQPTYGLWVTVAAVAPWQLIGACAVAETLPAVHQKMVGDDAHTYASLFGKCLVSGAVWERIGTTLGRAVAERLWGSHAEELGNSGSSGLVEIYSLEQALHDSEQRTSDWLAPDSQPLFWPFRTMTPSGEELYDGIGALPRELHP